MEATPEETPPTPTAAARLVDEQTGEELDGALLTVDRGLYPDGIRLFAIAHEGERHIRLEIDGPNAERWHPTASPLPHQTLGDRLSGHEEWYANREPFYGEGYFAARGPVGEAALHCLLRTAEKAQERFVDTLLPEVPFRSSLEFGCASGAMVRALRRRGVDARGVDLSPFILSKAAPGIREHLTAGDFSQLDHLDRPVETVIGQEVFEHIPPFEIDGVLRRIRRASTRFLVFTVPCTPQNGFHHIDRFADLPKDAGGNPVEGHLVQASRWWWIARAILAGFAFEEDKTLRARRRMLELGRRWNLFVFRPLEEDDRERTLSRLDRTLRPSFGALRFGATDRFIETGRLVRTETGLAVEAGPRDPGGYIYYGPYLHAGRGRIHARVRVRSKESGESLAEQPGDPAVWISITSNRGTLREEGVPAGTLLTHPGDWIDIEWEVPVKDDRDVQVKVYHTGLVELQAAWPPECAFQDGRGPGFIDHARNLRRAIRRRTRRE
ncbi:MAG: class I SAM-dependent methyltransferase [Candidatus Eisenbacteria bacterium]|nr:class I SAM-dependent methyltransferase [Candidatus Eisenbacteria bacterium]